MKEKMRWMHVPRCNQGKKLGGHFFKIPQSVIDERQLMKQAVNSKAVLDGLVG